MKPLPIAVVCGTRAEFEQWAEANPKKDGMFIPASRIRDAAGYEFSDIAVLINSVSDFDDLYWLRTRVRSQVKP